MCAGQQRCGYKRPSVRRLVNELKVFIGWIFGMEFKVGADGGNGWPPGAPTVALVKLRWLLAIVVGAAEAVPAGGSPGLGATVPAARHAIKPDGILLTDKTWPGWFAQSR